MSTLQNFSLSKPIPGEPIPVSTLAYFRARGRRKLHSLILAEFKDSGISQAELCRRLRKEPAQISRMLGSPSNLRPDSASDLLFAISGAEIVYQTAYPLDKPPRNFRKPDWLDYTQTRTKTANGAFFDLRFGDVPPQ
ncbi:MAG: hypothetical protein ABSA68_11900 [Xanthobacteraceae bacterium]|jgi:hypothetical protein